MYSIVFSDKADEQFDKLEKIIQDRVLRALERIRLRPYDFVQKLVGSDLYKIRVGDYRVILDVKDDMLVILVVEVGHRKNIYK